MNVSASRRDFLDYAKAIGIILVVWGHSGIGLNRYISSFHMPLFFLISGYLYSDARSWGSFVVRKVKSLYVPYFVWNALTLLLAIAVGAIAMRPDRICNTLCRIALTTTKVDCLLGATWFLATLFWGSLAFGFSLRLLGTGKLSQLVFDPVLDRLDRRDGRNGSSQMKDEPS